MKLHPSHIGKFFKAKDDLISLYLNLEEGECTKENFKRLIINKNDQHVITDNSIDYKKYILEFSKNNPLRDQINISSTISDKKILIIVACSAFAAFVVGVIITLFLKKKEKELSEEIDIIHMEI